MEKNPKMINNDISLSLSRISELEEATRDLTRIREALTYRLNFEKAIAQVSRILFSSGSIDLTEVIEITGKAIGANQAYIVQIDFESGRITNTYEWVGEGPPLDLTYLHDLDVHDFQWLLRHLVNDEEIIITDVEQLPQEAAKEKEIIQRFGFISLIAIPVITIAGKPSGLIGFSDNEKAREWTDEDILAVQLLANLISTYWIRCRAEEDLRGREAMLQSVFRSAPVGIGMVINRMIQWGNDRLAEMTGYTIDELSGQSARILYKTIDEFKRVGSVKYDLIKTYGTGTIETQWVKKTGEIIDILLSSTPIDQKDISRGVTFTALDITDRKRAEESVRKSERRFRLAAQCASDLIFEWQLDEDILEWYGDIDAVLGYNSREFPRTVSAFLERIHSEDRPRIAEAIDYYRKVGDVVTLEYRIRKKDGSVLHWSGRGIKVPDKDGGPGKIIGACTDVTEKVRTSSELLKAEKLESVGILAGGIAHDFNNILTSILGNISLARLEAGEDSELSSSLGEAERATVRAADLTQQLLTFSKGNAPIFKTTSVAGIIRETALFVLRGSNVKCNIDISDNLPNVDVDEGQFSQVIHNLIINADQAMPGGGIISISCHQTQLEQKSNMFLTPGPYICISVADEGVGISAKNLKKIFDPFFTTKQTGSGLGLATTFSIIKQHRGHISVESALDSGTTFYIYLPVSTKAPEKTKKLEFANNHNGGHILVMDDEESVRNLCRATLARLGYEVTTVADGKEAIEAYRGAMTGGAPIDAVIMDITIPGGMGGVEAITHLQTIDPQVRAIVSSGYSTDPVMADFVSYGFSGSVAKPYRAQQLAAVLHSVLSSPDQ